MDPRIKNVLDKVEEHLSDVLHLRQMAAMAHLSPSQFHRLFKKETGRTPFKFVEEIKMNKAYDVLLHQDILVQDLADDLGYKDYETFTRAFKKYFILSPDAIKSIALQAKSDSPGLDKSEVIIATIPEDVDNASLSSRLRQIIKDKKFTEEDLKEATIYTISKKTSPSSPSSPSHLLIKNKYEMEKTSSGKIWEMLINKS